MKYWILIASLFLSACAPNDSVKLQGSPCLQPIYQNDFQLCAPYELKIDNEKFTIPKGFVTDLASVPRLLWPLYSPLDFKTIGPAILHDYLYACPGTLKRSRADKLFYSALICNQNNALSSTFYWLAVRMFGSSHFREGYQCVYDFTPNEITQEKIALANKAY